MNNIKISKVGVGELSTARVLAKKFRFVIFKLQSLKVLTEARPVVKRSFYYWGSKKPANQMWSRVFLLKNNISVNLRKYLRRSARKRGS